MVANIKDYQEMISLSQNAGSDMMIADSMSGKVKMSALRGEMRVNEPMSKHVSWRAGGYADRYYIPADLEDLANFLKESATEPVYVIGLGSNLLVRDDGLRGTVVALHARLNDLQLIRQDRSGGLIYAGAGVACAKIARFSARQCLGGAEFLAGIPGTAGGALAMNAGCYGSEIWMFVERVRVINRTGQIFERQPDEYAVCYRSVRLHHELSGAAQSEWFVGAYLKLPEGNPMESRQRIKQLLARRVGSQPLNQPNAGSVFRNPAGDYAARLIEASGLKGTCIGGAMVSPKHANFIVNTGNASAADIETLIMQVQAKVKKETGVELIQEVRIVGDAGRVSQ